MKLLVGLLLTVVFECTSARNLQPSKHGSGCPALTSDDLGGFSLSLNRRLECFVAGVKNKAKKCEGKAFCKSGCTYRQKSVCPTDAEILDLFTVWNAAAATGDPAKVADLYTSDAVLVPTMSNDVRTTRAGIIDYFAKFLKDSPQGVMDEYEIRHLAEGFVANLGLYTFTFSATGQAATARFSFDYKFDAGSSTWLIAAHHSSGMPESTVQEVEAAFDTWNAALSTGDPQLVADLYASDAVLLPTQSNKPRNSREEIVDYYLTFLQLQPVGTISNIAGASPNIHILASGIAINAGIYVFDLTDPVTGAKSKVRARYTFVYQKRLGGAWMIVSHHSSAMPEAE